MKLENNVLTRREALGTLGLLALVGRNAWASSDSATTLSLKPLKGIALQLYTVRDQAKKDLPGTLKKVREIGFTHVQWSGMPDLSAEAIRDALKTADLIPVSAHVSVEKFEKSFDEEVRFWKTVGVAHIATGTMMADCKSSLEAWKKGAARLDKLGAKLRDEGIRFAYHNHNFEFAKFPGDDRCKLDILLESTKPENVAAEFDVAWVHRGGADPAKYLLKYKGRTPMIHVKDTTGSKKGQKFTPLGQGDLKWQEVFAAAHEAGVEWYIYEQDSGEGSPFGYAQKSFEFLTKTLQ